MKPTNHQFRPVDLLTMEPQNLHIARSLMQARACVDQLVQRGYVVLEVHIVARNPVIWIQNSTRCERLGGGMIIRRNDARGVETIMATDLDGCQVHWRVVGH